MVILRSLTVQDIGEAKMLSDAESWNQTEKDWEFIIRNPGNLCLAAEIGGKLVGTATAMSYEGKIAWIGMVLVHREYRGKGISKLLLSEILETGNSFISVKLDATPAGQNVYQGLRFKDEFLIHRMSVDSVPAIDWQLKNEKQLELLTLENISEVTETDRRTFGADRTSLLQFLLANYPENAWIIRKNSRLNGFAFGRKGTRSYEIGPLTATTTEEAKVLILKMLSILEGESVIVDILEDKKDLLNWLLSIGFKQNRHLIRMYRDENKIPRNTKNQFLICGPEFG